MSTRNFFATAIMALALVTFTACGDNTTDGTGTTTTPGTDHNQRHEWIDEQQGVAATTYQCPMKCEGDLIYNEPGRCPVCKMELKPVADEHHGHDH